MFLGKAKSLRFGMILRPGLRHCGSVSERDHPPSSGPLIISPFCFYSPARNYRLSRFYERAKFYKRPGGLSWFSSDVWCRPRRWSHRPRRWNRTEREARGDEGQRRERFSGRQSCRRMLLKILRATPREKKRKRSRTRGRKRRQREDPG